MLEERLCFGVGGFSARDLGVMGFCAATACSADSSFAGAGLSFCSLCLPPVVAVEKFQERMLLGLPTPFQACSSFVALCDWLEGWFSLRKNPLWAQSVYVGFRAAGLVKQEH